MKVGLRTLAMLLSLCASGLVAIAACSNQGEGERCEYLNNNDDCDTADNLICYRAAELNNTSSDRCCPVDRSTATNAVCATPNAVGAIDATAPAETGPPPTNADASVTDAGEDAADADLDAGDGGD